MTSNGRNGLKTTIIACLITALSMILIAYIVMAVTIADKVEIEDVEKIINTNVTPLNKDLAGVNSNVQTLVERIHSIDIRTRLTQQQVEQILQQMNGDDTS